MIVTRDQAKRQLQLEPGDDDTVDTTIDDCIADAQSWVENYTGHILVARDVVERFAGFDRLQLRAWPVQPGVAVAVSYDIAGATTAIDGARFAAGVGRPARVLPAPGTRWPSGTDDVAVAFRAGYEPGDTIPGNLRRGILVMIAGYFADREGGDVFQAAEAAAKSLCRDFRARSL